MSFESTAHPLKVIVCDDSENLRRHLAKLLGRLPYVDVIGETANVNHTLRAVARTHPDGDVLADMTADASPAE